MYQQVKKVVPIGNKIISFTSVLFYVRKHYNSLFVRVDDSGDFKRVRVVSCGLTDIHMQVDDLGPLYIANKAKQLLELTEVGLVVTNHSGIPRKIELINDWPESLELERTHNLTSKGMR